MKKALLIIFCTALAITVHAQTPVPKDSLYIITYTTGPSWDKTKSPGEQPNFKEHSSRLSKLRKEGVIKFGARYADKGIIVIAALSTTAAKELVSQDPAVISKLFDADVQKLNIFYDGCLNKGQ